MLYLSSGTPPNLHLEIERLGWGYILGPKAGTRLSLVAEAVWAADNGCFSAVWKADAWTAWLAAMLPALPSCLFAVVPDVVADHTATLTRWYQWYTIPAELGYPLAFVAQDGCTPRAVPWGDIFALFVGGSTAWKLSEPAYALARKARCHGKWVHLGRVNSQRRLRAAYTNWFDSADGTYMAYNPTVGIYRMGSYLLNLRRQATLPL